MARRSLVSIGEPIRVVAQDGEEKLCFGHPIRDLDGQERWLASIHPNDDAVRLLDGGLHHVGRPFEDVHPSQPARMEAGECHWQTRELVLAHPRELHMVAGIYGKRKGNMIFVNAHSWCTDPEARILDPTQDAREWEFYFGVPVPHRMLPDDVSFDYFGLDDAEARWNEYEAWALGARRLNPRAPFLDAERS